ncbi:hypothetical protein FEZ60_25115 [Rhodococcus sp. MS16]|uniref:hypothetical protein n=1 Tax=Rhodococcus sp. MS16 TaxID=2579941 RepID=UPI001562B746|nr:hypothetical protein [Rhodococcus sp. MS16]NRI68805.1 hypothetical protein [Rhodococcus sp. MS16]
MDGNSFAIGVFIAFNVLSVAGGVFFARRSYVRHRHPLRALLAGVVGLFIAPVALMMCVALARPQGAIGTR